MPYMHKAEYTILSAVNPYATLLHIQRTKMLNIHPKSHCEGLLLALEC